MFYRLPKGDLIYLAALLALAAAALLPDWGERTYFGVHVLAWWMAGLMLLSPIVALVRLLVEER